jgi:hypothetical protein
MNYVSIPFEKAYVTEGFGHGFQTLVDDTKFSIRPLKVTGANALEEFVGRGLSLESMSDP